MHKGAEIPTWHTAEMHGKHTQPVGWRKGTVSEVGGLADAHTESPLSHAQLHACGATHGPPYHCHSTTDFNCTIPGTRHLSKSKKEMIQIWGAWM
jgi:hypothetical protein